MKIRPYLTLIITGAVTAAFAVALSAWLWHSVRRYHDVTTRLETTARSLQQLGARKPFPNAENVARAETNRVRIEAFFQSAMGQFLKNQFDPPPMEPARFPQFLQRAIGSMNLAVVSNNVAVPERFMYGFDRYARGQPPDKADIPRLARQIHAVETISKAIFSAKIREMMSIERHVFEDELREGAAALARSEEAEGAGERATGVAAGYFEDPNKLYVRERLVYEFRARESAVWDILDALPRLSVFCVVSDIDIWNDSGRPTIVNPADGQRLMETAGRGVTAEGLPAEEAAFLAAEPLRARAAAAAPTPTGAAPRRPLKHEERTVAGMTETLKVRLQVDFYSFRRPEAAAGAEETKP